LICPVCNALSLLEVSCPNCGSAAEDEGRWSDWSGPYAPYETQTVFAATNMTAAADEIVCQHSIRCIRCHLPFTVEIAAWHV
jgi:hypothetical protein